MTRKALVVVDRDPRRDGGFAEALRMAVGLTLGVADVEVVLAEDAVADLAGSTAIREEEAVRKHLATLRDLGVPVHGFGRAASDVGLEPCSEELLAALVSRSGSTLVW